MRVVAAIPGAGLLAGAAIGLLLSDSRFLWRPAVAGLATCVACATLSWARARPRALVVCIACGFLAGGALLSAAAWQRAWRSPLRVVFEDLARAQRQEAEAEGRRLPADDEAFATVEGVLRSDASPSESGVSLTLDVDVIVGQEGQEGREGQEGHESREGRDGRSAPPSALESRAGRGGKAFADRARGGIAATVVGSIAPSLVDTWRAGRRVRMPVMLRRPPRYLDPGVPDHERELARRGVTLVGTVKSGALVDVLARAAVVDEALGAVRAFARRAIASAVGRWSPQSAAIVAAIVIGDRSGLDPVVQQRLQEAGTYHVIAISGGNIAILAGLLVGIFRLGGWLGRSAMLAAILALAAYARLVGGGASVDRATLMAIAAFGARAWDHRSSPLNALAVVAAVLVAGDPLSVADPAFVLTCGATLAILLVMPALVSSAVGPDPSGSPLIPSRSTSIRASLYGSPPKPGRRRKDERLARGSWFDKVTTSGRALARLALALFAASVAVEAMLFPVVALVFSRVTFAGLALNFLAIPLMGLAQIAGMALVPLALVSPAGAALVGWFAHAGAAGLVWSANLVRLAPVVSYRVAPPAWPVVVAYYAALAAWWALHHHRAACGSGEPPLARRARRAAASLAACTALWILLDPRTVAAARGDGRLHLTFIDVGQGDSAFILFPRGSTMLVDSGGTVPASAFDVGDRVVAPVVRAAAFRRIGVLALTHGDPDHIGGASSILSEFRPREVWEGIPVPRLAPLNDLRLRAQSQGARWANMYAGERRVIDGVDLLVHHPPVADWERQKVRNDDSLVLELQWRDFSVLLTGDIGRAVERDLVRTLPPARLRILKIPHHGSLTSSTPEFVASVRPQVAIASAGRNNHFGHPVPEVLERYRAVGAEVFRTDRDGAVTVGTDGWAVEVSSFGGRRWSRGTSR